MENDQAAPAVEENPHTALLGALDETPEELDEEGQEGEPSDDDQSEAEEGDDAAPKIDQKFRVKVKNDAGEDEDRDLSLDELAAGYMQSADYTRKTQQAAAHEKQRQEQFYQAVNQTTQQAQQQLSALQSLVLTTAVPELQQVNWQQLAAEDPARYVQLQARQQQLSQVLGAIQAEQQQLTKQQEDTKNQQREQAIKHSLEYLGREIPGFNLEKERNGLMEVGRKYGFADGELAGIVDGRMLHVLRDAMQWRSLQTAKPKAMQKVTDAPKVLKPSAPQPKKTNQSALERLRKSGRASDLVSFL